jgi:methanogenic corrinoid protein MtbC1
MSYINALANLREKRVLELTKKRLEAEEDPLKILDDITKAMRARARTPCSREGCQTK